MWSSQINREALTVLLIALQHVSSAVISKRSPNPMPPTMLSGGKTPKALEAPEHMRPTNGYKVDPDQVRYYQSEAYDPLAGAPEGSAPWWGIPEFDKRGLVPMLFKPKPGRGRELDIAVTGTTTLGYTRYIGLEFKLDDSGQLSGQLILRERDGAKQAEMDILIPALHNALKFHKAEFTNNKITETMYKDSTHFQDGELWSAAKAAWEVLTKEANMKIDPDKPTLVTLDPGTPRYQYIINKVSQGSAQERYAAVNGDTVSRILVANKPQSADIHGSKPFDITFQYT